MIVTWPTGVTSTLALKAVSSRLVTMSRLPLEVALKDATAPATMLLDSSRATSASVSPALTT